MCKKDVSLGHGSPRRSVKSINYFLSLKRSNKDPIATQKNVLSVKNMLFIKPVDTLSPIKVDYGEPGTKYTWSIDLDTGFWIPIKGPDGLGHHNGIDFDCPVGSVVRSMSDGFILRSKFENHLDTTEGSGLYILQLVILPGFDSWVLKYTHLKSSFVSPGQSVKRGEAIAESGFSGNSLSSYLHVDLMNLSHQWRPIPLDN